MYSKYNTYLKNVPEKDYTTIYNLFTKNVICVRNDLVDDGTFPEETKQKMMDFGMIVDSHEQEVYRVKEYYEKCVSRDECLNITLVLTGQCNCKCVYCYESEIDLAFNNYENVDETIKFVKKKMGNYSKLIVTFFGGEPLLCKDKIDLFASTFYKLYGSNFEFAIITNGTLLDNCDIKQWYNWGLSCLKITLDGNRFSHNMRRPLKNGENAYEKIVENLKSISIYKQIEIIIVLVVDEEIFGLSEMIQDLKNINIEAKFCISIREPDEYDVEEKKKILLDCASELKRNEVFQFNKLATNHGEICCGKMKNTYIIDGKGKVYGCTGKLNKNIGNISENVEKHNSIIKESCMDCRYLPLCYGDCPFEVKCEKNFFEKFVEEWLKLFIE